MEQLRLVKDAAEIGRIRSAIRIAEKAFAMFRAMIRPEDNEKELVDAMEMYVRRAEANVLRFRQSWLVEKGPRCPMRRL